MGKFEKQYVQEAISMMNMGLKLTEIGIQNNKSPEEVVAYFLKIMETMEKQNPQQTE